MKRGVMTILLGVALLLPLGGYAEGVDFGVQADSQSYLGFLVRGGFFEAGLKGQFKYYETSSSSTEMLIAGAHLSFLLHGHYTDSDFGIGADFRNGFGEDGSGEYDQYIDLFLRLSYNYHVSERFMVSALFFPIELSTRETEVDDSFTMTVKIPSAAVAATFLF